MATTRWAKLLMVFGCAALVVSAYGAQHPVRVIDPESSEPAMPTWSHSENWHGLPVADGRDGDWKTPPGSATQSHSILTDTHPATRRLAGSTQPSPGIVICDQGTTYDLQCNDNAQQMIATQGSASGSFVHFTWIYLQEIPDSLDAISRYSGYNCWSQTMGLGLGNCEYPVYGYGDPAKARVGFPTIDVGAYDVPSLAFHARNEINQVLDPPGPYSTYTFNGFAPCFNFFGDEEFTGSTTAEAIWPHIRVDVGGSATKAPGDDVYHVCSHPTGNQPPFLNEILYWRRVGNFGNSWEGPVVLDRNAGPLNYHVATDPTSTKVAVFYMRDDFDADQLLQVGFVESLDNGNSWISAGGFPDPIAHDSYVYITTYTGPEGVQPQSWVECQGEYDLSGVKHCVWIEQIFSNQTADCRLKHWDEIHGIGTIKQALNWGNVGGDGARDLWLASPNLAFGNGTTTCHDGPGDQTNLNYVYVTFEQYGGPSPAEANDVSASGNVQNLEIYLAISNDGGNTFSPSQNLTNTKSPGCDGTVPGMECASERDPSLAHMINDTLHLLYILDTDAGDAVFGQGYWSYNPVMYLRIPGGTDSDALCPEIAPVFAAQMSNQRPGCEYHAGFTVPPLQLDETLTIENFGNARLNGSVYENPAADWLVMSGGAYSIEATGPANVRLVTMNATAASVTGEGLYQTTIEVSHNDPSLPSPFVIPVDFFVFDEFYCPEFITLNTGWLWLTISNVERVADETRLKGGLSRLGPYGDSSYSIFDGSLLVGRPPYEFDPSHPGLDTIVFRNIYGEGNGQPGFRALGNLIVDTNAYGSYYGFASTKARQTTSDSLIGIDTKYTFPQHPDSSEFVLIDYALYNRSASAITGLAIGQATDFDVVPSRHAIDSIQPSVQNAGHIRSDFNLLYQQGADSAGHIIIGYYTATRFKGGITAIQCSAAPRGWIAPNDPWLFSAPGGGFSEDYLWEEMTKSGFELFPPENPDPEEDLHTVMVFEQNVDLGANDVKHYTMAYVSSNTGTDETDIINTTKKAWKYAFGWQEFVTHDTLLNFTPASYPYYAVGSHAEGLSGGCCGCVVTKTSGDFEIYVSDNGDCTGRIGFSGGVDDVYNATIRLETPCGGYIDEFTIEIVTGSPEICDCPYQGDMDGDSFIGGFDLSSMFDAIYFGGPRPQDANCPASRADFNADHCPDALDIVQMVNFLLGMGPAPVDPCAVSNTTESVASTGSTPVPAKRSVAAPQPVSVASDNSYVNRVVVESKMVAKGASTTVGVYVENNATLTAVVVPLAIRSLDPGSFISSLSLVNPTLGSRMENSLLAGVSNGYATENGACGFGQPNAVDYSSPDGVLLARVVGSEGSPLLPPGSDFDIDRPSFSLNITVSSTEGTFVIDTTCVDPCNHLIFCDASPSYILPSFVPGYIHIGDCSCPHQCDFNIDGFLDALDLNVLIDVLFFGGLDPIDYSCPTTRSDFNFDGFPDALDLNALIDHLFFGGPPPVDPCAP